MTDQPTNMIRQEKLNIGDGHSLEIFEVKGSSPGPTVSVIGGVHGDEEEGVLSIKRFIQSLKKHPISGVVRCLPVANPSAYGARNRISPIDNKNLARTFPGAIDGSVTERIAHCIKYKVIDGSDAMIDLHSAGLNYSMPLFCGYFELGTAHSRQSAKIARSFGVPIVWAHTQANIGRTLSAALELGVPAIYAECGGGGEVRAADTNAYVNGMMNVLSSLGMLVRKPMGSPQISLITDCGGDTDKSIASPASGMIVTHAVAGGLVKKGELLFEVYDGQGETVSAVESPITGIVMLLRRTARIDAGEMLQWLRPRQWTGWPRLNPHSTLPLVNTHPA